MTRFSSPQAAYDVNYHVALALDPEFGILDQLTDLSPDFMNRHPSAFKSSTKKNDPDSPNIVQALSGQYRDKFLEAMKLEIDELEGHNTWEVMWRSDIKEKQQADGTFKKPDILPSTWAYKVKRFTSGLLRKIKARFCARGDRQLDVNVFDTYAPVASWKSIRMLMITSLRQKWVTRQIDFSNAFVQAPM